MAATGLLVLLLVLEQILGEIAHDGTTDRSKESVTRLLTKKVACDTTANGAEEAAVGFGHWGCVGVVVRSIRVAGLRGGVDGVGVYIARLALFVTATLLMLAGLGVGIICSIVSGMTLRVACIVLSILATLLTVLEAALLRWAVVIALILILAAVLLVFWLTVLLLLSVALLHVLLAILVLLPVPLLGLALVVAALALIVAALVATVRVVGTGHGDGVGSWMGDDAR